MKWPGLADPHEAFSHVGLISAAINLQRAASTITRTVAELAPKGLVYRYLGCASPDLAVDRDPRQDLGGDEVAAAAADLPDPLVGQHPAFGDDVHCAAEDSQKEIEMSPPAIHDGTVVLRNCPFHQLAREHTDLICGMNLCLLDAAVEGVGETGLDARLEPEEGFCCVKLHATG